MAVTLQSRTLAEKVAFLNYASLFFPTAEFVSKVMLSVGYCVVWNVLGVVLHITVTHLKCMCLHAVTLLHSMQTAYAFYERRVCIVRTMGPWRGKMSLCLSVTHLYSVKMANPSQFFPRRVARPILFFHNKRYSNSPTGTPQWGIACKGYEKITIFHQHLVSSWK